MYIILISQTEYFTSEILRKMFDIKFTQKQPDFSLQDLQALFSTFEALANSN